MGRVEACRICLNTDVKMERIQGSLETNIKSVFGHNVLFSSDLPDYSCYECSALITKFTKFRKKYLTAQSLLFNILQNHGMVTEKEIKNIDRVASKLNSNMSTTPINSDSQVLQIKIECDPMEDVLDMTVEDEMDNSGSEDEVPLHSVKQIEHVNVNSINKKQHTTKRNSCMDTENDSGKSNKIRKLSENNARNETLLQDFDVSKLTDQADANGIAYLQADDFDNELPDMDDTVEEYNPSSSEIYLKILENQNLMLTNQHTIISKLADFSARFQSISKSDKLTRTCATYKLSTAKANSGTSVIENKKQLDEFENELNDPEKRQMLREKYSILFNGRGDGFNCAYILIDALFSRQFMPQCSWAGGSRGDECKIPFRAYKNAISFFHEIVHDCDSNFSMIDCHRFMRCILKNSTKRCTSKLLRMSAPRKRRRKATENIKTKELLGLEETEKFHKKVYEQTTKNVGSSEKAEESDREYQD